MKLSENTYRSRTAGRYVLRIIAAVLSLTVVISSVSVGSLAANDSSEAIVTLGHPITDDDFLQTDGRKIVNRKGRRSRSEALISVHGSFRRSGCVRLRILWII